MRAPKHFNTLAEESGQPCPQATKGYVTIVTSTAVSQIIGFLIQFPLFKHPVVSPLQNHSSLLHVKSE